MTKQIKHVLMTMAAVATTGLGLFPTFLPVAAALHVAPQLLTLVGTALAFAAHLPTVLGRPAPAPVSVPKP